ncbi:MAG: DUF4332 domain-containing protein [Chloroflexota bacterium]
MGFLAPFILGIVAGSVAMWQWGRIRQTDQEDALDLNKEIASESTADAASEESADMSEDKQKSNDTGRGDSNLENVEGKADDVGLVGDKLETIHGIGHVYAERLNAAGIQTFAQLAELSPDQVREIVTPGKADSLLNVTNWIAQAQQLIKANTVQ